MSEKNNNKWYSLGVWAATDNLVEVFAERSGDAYRKGDDEFARFYRALAEEFRKSAKNKRDAYDKEFPK